MRVVIPIAALCALALLAPSVSAVGPVKPMVMTDTGVPCFDLVSCSIARLPIPDEEKVFLIQLWLQMRELVCTRSDLQQPGAGVFLQPDGCTMIVSGYPHPPQHELPDSVSLHVG